MSRRFDGNSANYLLATIQSISAYPFSLSFWQNWDVVESIETPVSLGSSTAADDSVRFRIRGNVALDPGGALLADNEIDLETTVGPQIATNWRHVAIVVTATNLDLWVDNILYSGSNGTAFSAINGIDEMCVGGWKKTASFIAHPFTGLVAEVSLWSLAFSSAQIGHLQAGRSPLNTTHFPTGPIDYWRLKGTASPEPNEIGGANDLAINGTVDAGESDPSVDDPPGGTGSILVLTGSSKDHMQGAYK